MQVQAVVGLALVSGLITFLVGAGAWRMQYERPLLEALRAIHADRRRRAWIHLWMVPAMFVTSAGVAGYAAMSGDGGAAAAFALMASIVYAMGAVCRVGSLAFRLTVVPWAGSTSAACSRGASSGTDASAHGGCDGDRLALRQG
jgi:hypothetical protein